MGETPLYNGIVVTYSVEVFCQLGLELELEIMLLSYFVLYNSSFQLLFHLF